MKGKPVTPPVVLSATYTFENSDELIDVVQHRTGYLYSRWDNPTVREVEQMLASMEGYSNVVGFASGMAAITSTILAFVEKGGRVVAIQTYGETYRFIHDYLPRIGVDTIGLNCDDVDKCAAEIKKGATLLFLESPMNPLLRVIDVKPLAQLAHEHGAVVVLDSTFASPVNQRPIELGVDIAIHSATKYLGGHHDLTAGFACCNEEHYEAIWKQRRMFGGILDPMTAFLTWRGMQTLEVRVKRQNDTAMTVAQFLSTHKHVDTVHYPGLPTHPDHAVAARQMKGFGGMLSFELHADYEGTKQFMDRMKIIKLATSLGGVTTLATQPVTNTHASLSPQERAAAGIKDSLVRLSIGLEDPQLLIDDLEQAFARKQNQMVQDTPEMPC